MNEPCHVCGSPLEVGTLQARNRDALSDRNEMLMVVKEFAFVRPGVPTSANPVSAFLQGLHEEPEDEALALTAYRCTGCGRVELYAAE